MSDIDKITSELDSAIRVLIDQESKQNTSAVVQLFEKISDLLSLDETELLLKDKLEAYSPNSRITNNLGLTFYSNVMYDLAIVCYKHRIKSNPQDRIPYNNIGLAYNRLGESRLAMESYEQALQVDKTYKLAGSNLLYLKHYIWGADVNKITKMHFEYADFHFGSSKNFLKGTTIDYSPTRKLRLGFLSGDFRFHAVSRYMEGILKFLDRRQFDIYIYNTYPNKSDPIALAIKKLDLSWIDVPSLKPDQLCQLIADRKIDFLFDLSGYTQHNRPEIFANRVSPIQVNYLGYPNTTGLRNSDYRITDLVSDPPGTEQYYREKLLRLPVAMWNYTGWQGMSDIGPLPFRKNGFITFGSMNNHAKLQAEWLKIWAKVLHNVPNSKLLIKSRAMSSQRIRDFVISIFTDEGVNEDRIISRVFQKQPLDHFDVFNEIDICLDSFPYNGTTTTNDSLYCGVPVATMSGELHVSRTSASILSQIGLEDWIAKTPDEFVRLCQSKAQDITDLGFLRKNLRKRLVKSSVGDPKLFCQYFEKLLRETWQTHCAERSESTTTHAYATPPQANIKHYTHDTNPTSNQPLISVLVCSADLATLESHVAHIGQTIGHRHEYIGVLNKNRSYSLADAYNKSAKVANGKFFVFVHDDVFFANKNWGGILAEKFKHDKNLGFIGLAGASYFQSQYPSWVMARSPFIFGNIVHQTQSKLILSEYSKAGKDQQVVVADGVFLATPSAVFAEHQFDAIHFDGFHFYDVDFCLRISEHFKSIVTTDILVKHLSGGRYDDDWKYYRQKFHKKHGRETVWSCAEGKPEAKSHLKRLNCQSDVFQIYTQQRASEIAALGTFHPKAQENFTIPNKAMPTTRTLPRTSVLFIHPNYPGQYKHVIEKLKNDKNFKIAFITRRKNIGEPNVLIERYAPDDSLPDTRKILHRIQKAVYEGKRIKQAAENLKQANFIPNVIVGHIEWGGTLFIKEVFPHAKIIGYCEYFFNLKAERKLGAKSLTAEELKSLTNRNMHALLAMESMDIGITPTIWQRNSHPKSIQPKLKLFHEGINIQRCKPDEMAVFPIPGKSIQLTKDDKVITYISRGFEPARGFFEYMDALALMCKMFPDTHFLMVGGEKPFYSPVPTGKTYKQQALDKYDIDPDRVHFTGKLIYEGFLKVLQITSAHIYFSPTLMLSWSMLEAMSCGAPIVASDTPPVTEYITHEVEGLLVDFTHPEEIANAAKRLLEDESFAKNLGRTAREKIVRDLDKDKMAPKWVELIEEYAS